MNWRTIAKNQSEQILNMRMHIDVFCCDGVLMYIDCELWILHYTIVVDDMFSLQVKLIWKWVKDSTKQYVNGLSDQFWTLNLSI